MGHHVLRELRASVSSAVSWPLAFLSPFLLGCPLAAGGRERVPEEGRSALLTAAQGPCGQALEEAGEESLS